MELNRILELLARKMGNIASEREMQELQDLLNEFPEHQRLIEIIESIETNKSSKLSYRNEATVVDESWELLQNQLEKEAEKKVNSKKGTGLIKVINQNWMSRVAFVGGILIISAGLWFTLYTTDHNKQLPTDTVQQLQVPYGEPDKKILPDGSEVWVNAGSNIRYVDNTQANTREIYLEGEAFFKVKHDAQHPFIVHAGTISITALGTEFNVEAYTNDNTIKTTLIKGKVQITMVEKPDQKIILSPNEKLSVTTKGSTGTDNKAEKEISYKLEPIDNLISGSIVPELAWMDDKLSFQNEYFLDLSKKMERRYNIHIVFRDSTLKTESLTGTFENESVQKALRLLQMTTPFRYRMERDSVFLYR